MTKHAALFGLTRGLSGRRGAAGRPQKLARARLSVETLEDRHAPAVGISGYAFHDLNANGVRDANEPALASSAINLYDAGNHLIGTAQTDATGFYRFLTDPTRPPAPQSATQTLQFADGPTNRDIVRSLSRFDPALGTLQRVEIRIDGRITSTIKAENLDPAAALISGMVQGSLTLSGVGVWAHADATGQPQTFFAGAYDGQLDFAGTSGIAFAPAAASGSQALTLTNAADLAAFRGTGFLNLTITPQASSSASGGGNLIAQISSAGGATVTVTYFYLGSQALQGGNYRVEQPTLPAGALAGQLSRDGVVLPWPTGARSIAVSFDATHEAANNNFAMVLPASLGGRVYIDANNDAIGDANETGISGVRIALSGADDLGRTVSRSAITDANGAYLFGGLRPGGYTITQTPPSGFLVGRINGPGALGGLAQLNRFVSIAAGSAARAVDYNFGWLKPATLSGYVYADANRDGVFGPGDRGLQRLQVFLNGVDDLGQPVSRVAGSDSTGYYEFTGLRPGQYLISQTFVPQGWRRGAITIGSIGGATAQDALTDILLGVGDLGRDYNFAFVQISATKRTYLGSRWRGHLR